MSSSPRTNEKTPRRTAKPLIENFLATVLVCKWIHRNKSEGTNVQILTLQNTCELYKKYLKDKRLYKILKR